MVRYRDLRMRHDYWRGLAFDLFTMSIRFYTAGNGHTNNVSWLLVQTYTTWGKSVVAPNTNYALFKHESMWKDHVSTTWDLF